MKEAHMRPMAHVVFHSFLMLIAMSAFTACGRKGDHDWRARLPEGRRVTYEAQTADRDAMGLAASYALPIQDVETDVKSGIPVWVRLDTSRMPDVDANDWQSSAQAIIADQQALFGLNPDELQSLPNSVMPIQADKVAVSFGVLRDGREIRDAMVQLIFYRTAQQTWRLGEWSNRSYAGVTMTDSLAEAKDFHELVDAWGEKGMSLIEDQALLLALRHETTGEMQLIPVHAYRVQHADSDAVYTITVKDGSTDIVEAYPERMSAFAVRANVYGRNYMDTALQAEALPFARLFNNAVSKSADNEGVFDLDAAGAYSLELAGKRARIVNNKGTALVTVAATLDDNNSPLNFSEADRRAVNTFTSINRINKFVRRHMREADVALLTQAILVRINVSDGSCNAFYDSGTSSISLYAAGNNCANMSNVNDVIYHEWGHGLDNYTGVRGGITDGAFSEGLADVLAAYYVNSPNMAPGFMVNNGTGIRNLKNTKSYPANRGEVHDEGQIIAGAFWDMREMLIARYGATRGAYLAESYFMQHLRTTDAYLNSYQSVLRLDDNDNNPATPSPNTCLINAAFAAHGLATPLNCEDASVTPPSVDNSLYLGLKGDGLSNVTLLAASPKADAIAACLGGREVCGNGQRTDVSFTLEGAKGAQRLFVADTPVNLKEQDLVTLIAKDQSGRVVGVRTLKVFSK